MDLSCTGITIARQGMNRSKKPERPGGELARHPNLEFRHQNSRMPRFFGGLWMEAGGRRSCSDLLQATRPFAVESPIRSWWYLLSTLAALGCELALTAQPFPWWIRLPLSVGTGLVVVRTF